MKGGIYMDIDSLKVSKKTDQLFLVCVDHNNTSHATFYYYKKEEKWELVLQTPALIGQRGMGEGKEGESGLPFLAEGLLCISQL